jgi:hypothetical protein
MHRIYMSFIHRQGWLCQFLEKDLKTGLPKKLALTSQEKVLEVAQRGGALIDLAAEQAIRHPFEIGLGGVWPNLTDEQYRKLNSFIQRSARWVLSGKV